jgi:hypothetical protein
LTIGPTARSPSYHPRYLQGGELSDAEWAEECGNLGASGAVGVTFELFSTLYTVFGRSLLLDFEQARGPAWIRLHCQLRNCLAPNRESAISCALEAGACGAQI